MTIDIGPHLVQALKDFYWLGLLGLLVMFASRFKD